MRELSALQQQQIAGAGVEAHRDVAQLTNSELHLDGWGFGGSVTSGAGGTGWSASAGYTLPGGASIGGHIGGFGGSVTGGGFVISIPL